MSDYTNSIEKALNTSENEGPEDKKNKNKVKFNYEKDNIFGKVEVSKNWQIEVTKTSWKGRRSKYEIRKWRKDGKPGKGVTCTKDQFKKLIEILKGMDIADSDDLIVKKDVVENDKGERGKVKKVEGEYLLVNSSKGNEKWEVNECEFVKKGRQTY